MPQRGNAKLGRSVRTEQYTFIEWPDGAQQLYDHARDPQEYDNLADRPEHAATITAMQKLLVDGSRRIGL